MIQYMCVVVFLIDVARCYLFWYYRPKTVCLCIVCYVCMCLCVVLLLNLSLLHQIV